MDETRDDRLRTYAFLAFGISEIYAEASKAKRKFLIEHGFNTETYRELEGNVVADGWEGIQQTEHGSISFDRIPYYVHQLEPSGFRTEPHTIRR